MSSNTAIMIDGRAYSIVLIAGYWRVMLDRKTIASFPTRARAIAYVAKIN